VIYKFQPNFAYTFDGAISEKSSAAEIEEFYDQLLATKDPFVNGEISISTRRNVNFEKSNRTTLIFKETHALNIIPNLLAQSNSKVIGLFRSPFSVINSWLKVPREFDPKWSIRDEWRKAQSKNEGYKTHYFGFDKWKEGARLYLKMRRLYPDRFYLAEYQQLLHNPVEKTKKLYDFCGLELTSQTRGFLDLSTSEHEQDSYSVFKTKTHDREWEKKLPKFIIEEIKKDHLFQELNEEFQWLS
jgi:hypothetical protein